ncbi:hypothetical protein QTP88_015150 [Uroleucon formosanum]
MWVSTFSCKESSSNAFLLLSGIRQSSFIISLLCAEKLSIYTLPISKILQSSDLDISEALNDVDGVVFVLRECILPTENTPNQTEKSQYLQISELYKKDISENGVNAAVAEFDLLYQKFQCPNHSLPHNAINAYGDKNNDISQKNIFASIFTISRYSIIKIRFAYSDFPFNGFQNVNRIHFVPVGRTSASQEQQQQHRVRLNNMAVSCGRRVLPSILHVFRFPFKTVSKFKSYTFCTDARARTQRERERSGVDLVNDMAVSCGKRVLLLILNYTRYTISVGQRSHQYVLVIYSIIAQRPTTASLSACRWASRSREPSHTHIIRYYPTSVPFRVPLIAESVPKVCCDSNP